MSDVVMLSHHVVATCNQIEYNSVKLYIVQETVPVYNIGLKDDGYMLIMIVKQQT